MRRAQVDRWSQPVRNYSGNPRFVNTGGTTVVRTNLALNPSIEGSSSTLVTRTNLIPNPRGVFAFSDYAGPTNQTITPNVAITGHPDGITTANRVTYDSTSINPGVTFMFPAASTTYTISAWVYHESTLSTPGMQGLAQSGVASMPSPPAIVTGQWTRITWNYSTGASANQLGFRVSGGSGTGTGSFLVTGVLIEASPLLGTFFDGATAAAGDYTYAWTGTANASTSTQRAPAIFYFSAASTAIVHQASIPSNQGVNGNKGALIITKGANGDGIFASDISVTPGASYTWSGYIKLLDALPRMDVVIRWKSDATTIITDTVVDRGASLTLNTWGRVSLTAVAPAGATVAQPMFRLLAAHTPGSFYLDAVQFEQSAALTPYFDGSKAAAGDFTYAWAGTANLSASYERATMVVSTGASKSGANLDAKFVAIQSTAEDGVKTVKWISAANSGNSTWRVASINGSSTFGWDYRDIKTGGRYTLFYRYRGSGWGAGQQFQTMIADGGAQNPVINYDTPQPLNTTGWVEYRRTFTALRDANNTHVIYMALPTVPQTATDGILEIRDWMLVAGEYTGDMIDGNQPLSKWDGTAHQSTSIGYPQQLLDIAGKPIYDVSAAGTYVLDNSFTNTEARTIYTVIENLGENTGGVSPIIQYGGVLNDTNPYTYVQLRQDANGTNGDGINNFFARRSGAVGANAPIKIGRHVGAWGINSAGKLFLQADGFGRATDTVVMDIPHQNLVVYADQPLNKHLRTIIYRGEHDAATCLAVSRFLGNKYGVNVA